jgi:hypothetical protein
MIPAPFYNPRVLAELAAQTAVATGAFEVDMQMIQGGWQNVTSR